MEKRLYYYYHTENVGGRKPSGQLACGQLPST